MERIQAAIQKAKEQRGAVDAAGGFTLAAAGRAGRLGVDGDDLMPGGVQGAQGRDREVRAAHEGEAHGSVPGEGRRPSPDLSPPKAERPLETNRVPRAFRPSAEGVRGRRRLPRGRVR